MEGTTPSWRVIEAIAQKEGVSPTQLTPPLYDVIETDALDNLLAPDSRPESGPIGVSFTYRGYEIYVESGDSIEVVLRGGPSIYSDAGSASEHGTEMPD